jgi:hypothetical protein
MPDVTTLSLLETVGMETKSFLNTLDETFPPFTPSPDDSLELIMYRAGQRSVVEYIQQQTET